MDDGEEAFEFVLEGPPVSVNAKEGKPKARSRYNKWLKAVAAAAKDAWPDAVAPLTTPVAVTISNYFTAAPGDIDNIIKPIPDGMNKVVYADDFLVYRVTSQKFAHANDLDVSDFSKSLKDALDRYSEVVHIVVTWKTNGER